MKENKLHLDILYIAMRRAGAPARVVQEAEELTELKGDILAGYAARVEAVAGLVQLRRAFLRGKLQSEKGVQNDNDA